MIGARVRGAESCHRAAMDLRRIHDRELTREIRGAVQSAVDSNLPPLLRASAAAHMPSGYWPVLSRDLRVQTRAAPAKAVVSVRIFAHARKELRDVQALNLGRLRHPVFGNRRNWAAQRVRSGFVDKAVTATRPRIVRDVDHAVSRIADKFNAGR